MYYSMCRLYMAGSWAVVDAVDQRLRFLPLNPVGGRDTQLPGWLKVRGGEVVPPATALLQRAVHVRTVHCENQVQVVKVLLTVTDTDRRGTIPAESTHPHSTLSVINAILSNTTPADSTSPHNTLLVTGTGHSGPSLAGSTVHIRTVHC